MRIQDKVKLLINDKEPVQVDIIQEMIETIDRLEKENDNLKYEVRALKVDLF